MLSTFERPEEIHPMKPVPYPCGIKGDKSFPLLFKNTNLANQQEWTNPSILTQIDDLIYLYGTKFWKGCEKTLLKKIVLDTVIYQIQAKG